MGRSLVCSQLMSVLVTLKSWCSLEVGGFAWERRNPEPGRGFPHPAHPQVDSPPADFESLGGASLFALTKWEPRMIIMFVT